MKTEKNPVMVIDDPIEYLAARLESMMPRIGRRLFTVDVNHPASELPSTQLRVCTFLLGSAVASISEIADELSVSVSAATQIADRLEKSGFVERTLDASDRRVKLLKLTSDGVAMMEARRAHRIARACKALEVMAREDRTELIESLDKLLAACLSLSNEPKIHESPVGESENE